MEINVTYRDIDLTIIGIYQPGYEGRMYMRNGDPGYPGEPAGFDEGFDILHRGESIADLLSDKVIGEIEALAVEEVNNRGDGYEFREAC